jgi:hypothetical protein
MYALLTSWVELNIATGGFDKDLEPPTAAKTRHLLIEALLSELNLFVYPCTRKKRCSDGGGHVLCWAAMAWFIIIDREGGAREGKAVEPADVGNLVTQ